MVWMCLHTVACFLALRVIHLTLIPVRAVEETRDCRELEFKDLFGNCKPCKQCDPGQELSKECGFGYGEDARCVPCRSSRFKEDRSLQKCKPCLDCGLINRFLKVNCSTTSNAVCGDCLPGYYKKTRLSGFQDMECIPCGSPPPPYEPHCGGRVNLVPLPSVVTSPQDMVLATVICSALATVLLALLVLCIIYCKRQLLEEKPSTASLRSQGFPYSEAELSCLDPCWLQDYTQRPCCRCYVASGHTCGPVHLVPSHCCGEGCSLDSRPFQTPAGLSDRNTTQDEEAAPVPLGRNPDFLCEEFEKMNGVNSPPLCFRWPQCNSKPIERRSEEEEERGDEDGCKPKKSPAEQSYRDSLSPTQHLSSEEG